MSFLSDEQKKLVDRIGTVASDIEARMMLGTIGLYIDDAQIGVVEDDAVYLRAGDDHRASFEEQGATPYNAGGGVAQASYFRVPDAILEDNDALTTWVEHAGSVAA
ncbi:TfoX/Sxy family protein [Longibacter salinarum]|nr:TfoX/Sxy family protein [Longibacter salinarum]